VTHAEKQVKAIAKRDVEWQESLKKARLVELMAVTERLSNEGGGGEGSGKRDSEVRRAIA
jgi:hypothetical protein